jgi:hypothetical protein
MIEITARSNQLTPPGGQPGRWGCRRTLATGFPIVDLNK